MARSSFLRASLTALLLAALLAIPEARMMAQAPGQQPSGPIIQSTGMSYKVDDPTFTVPEGYIFKGLFVVDAGGNDTARVSPQLTTMARFLNIHGRHGYPESRVQVAAVVHGNGWGALLTDSAFTARFGGTRNPHRKLVEELLQHGTQLVLCGQTAGGRGIKRDELLPGVKVAISAMTAFNVLQSQGFRYNPW